MEKQMILRLHKDRPNDPEWEYLISKDSAGTLKDFEIVEVDIPNPAPKTEGEDVPGTNGIYDKTEFGGRVFYQNRTITVKFVFKAGATWTSTIDGALARYNGRLCDFAFDAPYNDNTHVYSPAWIYTGRLTVERDRPNNSVTFKFDAWPYCVSPSYTVKNVPVATNIDKNSFGWTFDRALVGSLTAHNNSANKFEISASDVGSVIIYKRTGLTAGATYTLGVRSIVGGSIAFHSAADGDNLTEGVVDSNGVLEVRITVDGSYYNWQTVDNQVFCYPSFRCEYILAKMVAGSSSVLLASNVCIHPEISNLTAKAFLILDGAVFQIDDTTNLILQPDGAVMPGVRADKSRRTAKSIFVCVPQTTGTPAMTIGYHEQEMM